jgi:cbb3-type cytochrome oxidase subunit 3
MHNSRTMLQEFILYVYLVAFFLIAILEYNIMYKPRARKEYYFFYIKKLEKKLYL